MIIDIPLLCTATYHASIIFIRIVILCAWFCFACCSKTDSVFCKVKLVLVVNHMCIVNTAAIMKYPRNYKIAYYYVYAMFISTPTYVVYNMEVVPHSIGTF